MVTGIGFPFYSPSLYGWGSAPPRKEAKEAPVANNLLAVQASSDTDAQISITTAEGDTVTISLHSDLDAGFAFYRPSGTDGGTNVQAAVLTSSASRSMEITVQGDLNDQEKADVSNLLNRLEHVIRSFLKGHFGAAIHQALEGPSLNSLAGYSLDVEHTESLTLVRASDSATQDPAGTGTIDQPATQPTPETTPPPDPATDGVSFLPRSPVQSPLGGPQPDVKDVLDQLVKTAKDSGIDLDRFAQVLTRMLRELLHQIGREPGMEPARPALKEIGARFPEHLHHAHAHSDSH